jgi:acyl-coenzyme A thioesterase PaaI-like protein
MPPILITEGPLAGWHRWRELDQGRFQDLIGSVYFRKRDDGSVDCRSMTGRQHSNMADMLHGGYIMAFVDQALYAIAADQLVTHRAVTVTCNTEFVGAGVPGEDVFANGEIIRATGSMLFLRGMVTQADRKLAAFSAVLKKVAPRP